jgi:hypothetical protein
MNHRLARLIATALGAATITAAAAPTPARDRTSAVDIVVDGAARPLFVHSTRLYVEALNGRQYAIRLRNPYPVRVAIALSVDGLNTIDARETSPAAARKWVLGPHQTVVIRGWQVSRTEARRFAFTTEPRSYGAALGKPAALTQLLRTT